MASRDIGVLDLVPPWLTRTLTEMTCVIIATGASPNSSGAVTTTVTLTSWRSPEETAFYTGHRAPSLRAREVSIAIDPAEILGGSGSHNR